MKHVNWRDIPCWIWPLCVNAYGYPVQGKKDRPSYIHIELYQLYIGPIPEGKELDHLCRTPGCVCPWHLELVSHQTNIRRGYIQTKLEHSDVKDIRRRYEKGTSARTLAQTYEVSTASIYNIVKGRTWKRKFRKEGQGTWSRNHSSQERKRGQ